MIRMISVIAIAMLLGACTTIRSPSVELISIENAYPVSLTQECEPYKVYVSSKIEVVIVGHTDNMEKAISCYNRHNQLVNIIKERNL